MRRVTTRLSAASEGHRRSRLLRQRLGTELETSRLAIGMSLREVARRIGVSPQRIARAERGDVAALTVDLAARIAPVTGLQLAAQLYPNGDPVRDRAQLALLDRFRNRLGPAIWWRSEVPVPISGDLRSGDAMLGSDDWDGLVEAETHLGDVQLIERRAAAKQRDLGAKRLILLVSDTRHNREVIRLHPELRARFPIYPRTCLARLGLGRDPGGDCHVIL
jgi:transcriptional regulator with XRE-family HTH domain